jgi:peptidoglycan/xylan/chitin deacetylase (PgdA/CDA1 family)
MVRDAGASLLSQPLVARAARLAGAGVLPIFVLHRVAATELLPGHDAAVLGETLDRLRRSGHVFVGLPAVLDAWTDGPPLPAGAVAFTADDGYADQAHQLVPVFEAHECPLTIFVTTGFLDRTWVPWWDVFEHAVATTEEARLDVEVGTSSLVLPLGDRAQRREAVYALAEAYKAAPADMAERAVGEVAAALRVPCPTVPFPPYEPMTWEDVRALAAGGLVSFGPHTLTHPVLARVDDERVEREVLGSWQRLQEELDDPLPVFCYPVGEDGDYGEREVRAVREAGLAAAVTVGHRHAAVARAAGDLGLRFRLDRLPLHDDVSSAVFAATGVTRVRDVVRRRRS